MNKRLLAGIAAAGIIGGGVYGFAATLTPVSDNLGAGADAVQSCDSTIDASYTVSYTTGGYKVDTVELSGIAALCDGETFQITLSDSSNASLAELTGTVAQATGSQSVPVTGTVLANAVEGIDVVVTGDNA
jgi:hypothetical protein